MIMGSAVLIPCPTSGFLDMMVTLPSAITRMNAVGSNLAFGDVGAGGSAFNPPCANTLENGSAYSASKKPPPPIALTRRKDRRPIVVRFVGLSSLIEVAVASAYAFPARTLALSVGRVD